MSEMSYLMQALLIGLKAAIPHQNHAEQETLLLLLGLTANSGSARWKEVGDRLLKHAELAASEDVKNGYIDVSFYCLRNSVDLARLEKANGRIR